MQNKSQADFANGSIGKLIFSMAIPAITAQIINLLYNIVDRMYIGHIPEVGAAALTGVGVSFPVITLIAAFSALIGMGGASRAAIYMGKQDNDTAEKILGNCFSALLIIAASLTTVILLFCEPLLMAFGASADTIGYAAGYLRIYAVGTVFVQIVMGLNMFITSQGFAAVGMKTTMIGAVINIVLDPIFIFGLKMGVQGAALATILSQAVSALWVLRFLTGKKTILRIRPAQMKVSWQILGPVIALGISPFIMQSTESLLSISFNTQLQKFGGDVAVGAISILTSIMQFGMMPLMGLTQGAQPIISYNFGARNPARVKGAFRLLLIACLVYSVSLWLCIMAFPQAFAGLFTGNEALINLCRWAMRVYMGASFVMGAQLACQQTFIAIGNAKYSMFLAILRKIILLIPLIYILPPFFTDKVMAVFLAEPIADALAVATTVTLFTVQFRKTIRAMEETKAA